MTAVIETIDVKALNEKLKEKADIFLLDVREPHEADLCRIPGSTLIPLGQIPDRLAEIPRDKPIIAACHHGGRSARAVQFLQQQGFSDCLNLTGGIDAWAVQIDPGMTRY